MCGEYKAYGEMDINDKTLSKRVERTLEQLSSAPSASISSACKNVHQAKAVYRLISNEKFTAEAVMTTSREETKRRIMESGERVIIIPQDTTTLNYSGLRQTEGLGDISDKRNNLGIMLHTAIAVGENGETFGILSEKAWVRPKEEYGKKSKRKQLPIEEKESYKWLETIEKAEISKEVKGIECIHVCDREGDIYEFFAKASLEGLKYICRRAQNRITINCGEEVSTNGYLGGLPVAGEILVNVPRDSHTQREGRSARLEIKYGTTLLKRTAVVAKHEKIPETVQVSLISAQEIDCPEGVEAISWQLVTNDNIETVDNAITCVKRYMQRWKIETFHYVLKSGCAIEKLESSTAEKLIKLIALYSVIALQIMILTFLARSNPDASCEIAFEEDEWKILYKVVMKVKSLPEKPPTIKEAVIMIAKLGGFLARKSDGFPGVTVIWRGITSFFSILDASQYLA